MARKKLLTDDYSAAARNWAAANLKAAYILCGLAVLVVLIWPLYSPWWIVAVLIFGTTFLFWRMSRHKTVPAFFVSFFYATSSFLREEYESGEIYHEHQDYANSYGIISDRAEREAEEDLDDHEGEFARHERVREERRTSGDVRRSGEDSDEVWKL